MEGSDRFRISSGRLSSSNIWRNTGLEAFSRSSVEVDDEEALKWAALERLPTNLRIRRGILNEDEGKYREIDIKNLGLVERRNLVERLLEIAEEGNEKFLLKLKERIQRYVCFLKFCYEFWCDELKKWWKKEMIWYDAELGLIFRPLRSDTSIWVSMQRLT